MAVETSGTTIWVPQGDTGVVKFVVEQGTLAECDKGLFTVVRRDGATILRKVLSPDEGGYFLPIVHEDTAGLKPDTYEWSLRIVRDGMFDANGRLTAVRGVHTPVLRGRLAVQRVAGGAR